VKQQGKISKEEERIFVKEFLFKFVFPHSFSDCAVNYLYGFSTIINTLGVPSNVNIQVDCDYAKVKFEVVGNEERLEEIEKLFMLYIRLPDMTFELVVDSNSGHEIFQRIVEDLVNNYKRQFNFMADYFKLHDEKHPNYATMILNSLYDCDNCGDFTSTQGKTYFVNKEFSFWRNDFPLSKLFIINTTEE
tara:strand:- start:501 stop:1070 length:570 start_codon:yes stop_codon:yes gene_type:complete